MINSSAPITSNPASNMVIHDRTPARAKLPAPTREIIGENSSVEMRALTPSEPTSVPRDNKKLGDTRKVLSSFDASRMISMPAIHGMSPIILMPTQERSAPMDTNTGSKMRTVIVKSAGMGAPIASARIHGNFQAFSLLGESCVGALSIGADDVGWVLVTSSAGAKGRAGGVGLGVAYG